MNLEEHKLRHEKLHQKLDELLADFLYHNPDKLPSNTTLSEFMQWSHEQTRKPTPQPEVDDHE